MLYQYWNKSVFTDEPEWDWAEIDARLNLPSDDQILRLARQINQHHAGQHNETGRWPADFRQVGLFAERAFCRVFACRMDLEVKRFGSGRANVILRDGSTVDVMGRRLRPNKALPDLTRRVRGHRQKADIDCLVLWIGRGFEPVFLGWLPDKEVKKRGTRMRVSYDNSENYVVPVALLDPMYLLMRKHNPESPLADENSEVPSPDEPDTPLPDPQLPLL